MSQCPVIKGEIIKEVEIEVPVPVNPPTYSITLVNNHRLTLYLYSSIPPFNIGTISSGSTRTISQLQEYSTLIVQAYSTGESIYYDASPANCVSTIMGSGGYFISFSINESGIVTLRQI